MPSDKYKRLKSTLEVFYWAKDASVLVILGLWGGRTFSIEEPRALGGRVLVAHLVKADEDIYR